VRRGTLVDVLVVSEGAADDSSTGGRGEPDSFRVSAGVYETDVGQMLKGIVLLTGIVFALLIVSPSIG
jgi:hypothetical protein